jgi:hypothetical protein
MLVCTPVPLVSTPSVDGFGLSCVNSSSVAQFRGHSRTHIWLSDLTLWQFDHVLSRVHAVFVIACCSLNTLFVILRTFLLSFSVGCLQAFRISCRFWHVCSFFAVHIVLCFLCPRFLWASTTNCTLTSMFEDFRRPDLSKVFALFLRVSFHSHAWCL